MKTAKIILIGLLLHFELALLFPQSEQKTNITDNNAQFGPAKGSLVIAGGGRLDTSIMHKFINLAGGLDASFVIIPTAMGGDSLDLESRKEFLTSYGVSKVTVLHTRDPEEANTEKFTKPILKADGVWFSGGRQWRLADSYLNTLTENELNAVLERGGVIGGSSAGATIQGSYLVRGDTKGNTLMMGDHIRGFSFLKNSAIDQHLLKRNRQFDLIEVLEKFPELLGIGLDESTAIVVTGDEFEVIGKSFVAIYDTHLWPDPNKDIPGVLPNGGRFFLLCSGDKYNIKTREVIYWKNNSRKLF